MALLECTILCGILAVILIVILHEGPFGFHSMEMLLFVTLPGNYFNVVHSCSTFDCGIPEPICLYV